MSGWAPFAIRRNGPAIKLHPGLNRKRAVVVHSMEGRWPRRGLPGILADVRPPLDERVSWTFSVLKDGRCLQHHPLRANAWHSGSDANLYAVGIEEEGFAGEPMTEPQLAATVELIAWIAEQEGWPGFRRGIELLEHREVRATACPSGRWDGQWPEIIRRLEEGEMPTDADRLRALAILADAAKHIADRRELPQRLKDGLKFLGS